MAGQRLVRALVLEVAGLAEGDDAGDRADDEARAADAERDERERLVHRALAAGVGAGLRRRRCQAPAPGPPRRPRRAGAFSILSVAAAVPPSATENVVSAGLVAVGRRRDLVRARIDRALQTERRGGNRLRRRW